MVVEIGSKYEENKARLREQVRKGTISVLEDNDAIFLSKVAGFGFPCCLCGKHIDGKVRLLVEEELIRGRWEKLYYPIDSGCYASAKGVYLVKSPIE